MNLSQAVVDFAELAIKTGAYDQLDRLYLQNLILDLIGETTLAENIKPSGQSDSLILSDYLCTVAKKNAKFDDLRANEEIFQAKLMNFLTPTPSEVNRIFKEKYAISASSATDYFFDLSKKNDYIKTRAISKNEHFYAKSSYGDLEITINLSKPEKDPKQIAAEKNAVQSAYPKCLLCVENEGYAGRLNHPTRTNHRIVRLDLVGETWGFQYSPYAYFNEHSIILAEAHRPMKIARVTFERLLAIVDKLPTYFAGSNADLPIVGGSILSHDHYQGGRHDFPMAKAELRSQFALPDFPNVRAGIVNWPMSVIRLTAEKSADLVAASTFILEKWQQYSDDTVAIVARTADGTQHHTITPIARRRGADFELDLVLRDNNTSAEFPDGIFHPHAEVHHIKRENIGLIEVMGLAILPGRLKTELEVVKNYVKGQAVKVADYHQTWADDLKNAYQGEKIDDYIQNALGKAFLTVLEHAGVFKDTDEGHAAFARFIAELR
ncbi:galactose-1-phosphate uridylyltransferase [Lactococcus hodotermopsidis]|uniref:Galactose-1-phosphate uridylyltransferase n=1 Tax=Pseudolactococcus hodotermopsidis TaxID=2709157 RepID=A0A6A0BFG7_9LACT|nr:UDP-glucose--hexose-1-phosphate uridylyltransferase [Lactococcus hodotermopsidis]GFH43098.1 galactose-1-phosphate uridylyltransferase [Lactococcus hodotermopsidis]